MSAQITRKSSDDHKQPLPPPPPGVMVDRAHEPVGSALLLAEWVPAAPVASHGRLPALPPAPRGLIDLGPAGALRVTGPDRESWLQGMQTGDLAAAPEGGAAPGVFLGTRGKTVADGLLWRFKDSVVVTVRPDRVGPLAAHLDKLLIMEDAELSPATGLHRLRFCPGCDAGDVRAPLGHDAGPALLAALAEVRGTPGPLGFDILVTESQAQALLAALPERPSEESLERWRVALGVPLAGKDFEEETNPLEAGLDAQISFDKGCYVGQEVIAMATYRGRVQWNLVRLEVEGAPPSSGTPLEPARGGKGRVTSAVQVGAVSLLLGIVHRERIVPGSTVPLQDGRVATVLGLPFGSRPGAGVCE